jgi:putative DNA primase/helicase
MTGPADPVAGLLNAMREAGIEPDDLSVIVADGTLRRFRVAGDKGGTSNGWAVLHAEHGAAGTWKGGATCTWTAKHNAQMSRAEREKVRASMQRARADLQRQRELERQQAAERAAELWAKARPASETLPAATHRYLRRKRIASGNARQSGELLVLRIIDIDGNLHGLQYIGPDGSKKMLSGTAKKGHFILTAGALPADRIVIAEGWATASTVATQFPGAAVLAAIDCWNLYQVARNVRQRHPGAEIVIAADDDRLTEGNPGLRAARDAAAAVGAKLIRPEWPPGSPLELSDFNDLAAYLGGAQ